MDKNISQFLYDGKYNLKIGAESYIPKIVNRLS